MPERLVRPRTRAVDLVVTTECDRNARDDARRMYALANRLWHSDASFRAVGAGYTLLHARVVPGKGGNTEFADMRAAYDALPAEDTVRIMLADLGDFDEMPPDEANDPINVARRDVLLTSFRILRALIG